MRALVIVLCVVVLLVLDGWTRCARADDASGKAQATAESFFHLAEAADARGDYAEALARYRAVIATSPSSRFAPRSGTRAHVLETHAEGNFQPFTRLESVRSDPARADDPKEIDALAKDADAFPEGLSRVEAWMVCADAYVARFHRHADGMVLLRKVLADTKTEPLTRKTAAKLLVETRIADGDVDGARDEADALAAWLEPRDVAHAHALVKRRGLRRAAIADLALVLLLAAAAVARGDRREITAALRGSWLLIVVFAAWVAVLGSVLASSYERGNAAPFLRFGLAVLPLVGLARAWGAAGSASTPARIARAALCASSLVAASFLVLDGVDAAYLESFGL